MARQGYDLHLTRYDERDYTTGMEHSPTSATGAGWDRTPWRGTAWEALQKSEEGNRGGLVTDEEKDRGAYGAATDAGGRRRPRAVALLIVV